MNSHTIPLPAPDPLPRNKFDLWCWVRGLRLADIGAVIGAQPERVRRLRLPFNDPLRAIPNEAEMARIVAWTSGEITPADFYRALLNGAPASDQVETGAAG